MEVLSFQQNDGEQYFRAYKAYKNNLSDIELSPILQDNLVNCLRSILDANDQLQQLNILSIGSGDGSGDIKVLTMVNQELQKEKKYQSTKIFLRAVEPNRYYNNLYQQAIEKLPDSLKNKTVFNLRQNTFEEFISCEHDKMEFDMIMFLQSIYYCDLEQSLSFGTGKTLKETGRLIVLLEPRGLICDVISSFSQAKDVFPPSQKSLLPYEQLLQIVAKNDWKCSECTENLSIDVKEVFEDNSENGSYLLDFLTHLKDFRKNASKEQLDYVLSLIEEKTVFKDGKRFGDVVRTLLVICKHSSSSQNY